MRIITKILRLFVIVLCLVLPCFSQRSDLPEKWSKIKTFISTREDVDKLFGNGIANGHFIKYPTQTGLIFVDYSAGNCKSTQYPIWNMPEWTVTEVTYILSNKSMKLNDVIPKRNKYKQKQAGDVSDHVEYYDDAAGVSIIYDKRLKHVLNIVLRASTKDKLLLGCGAK